jgi:general stress protein 26
MISGPYQLSLAQRIMDLEQALFFNNSEAVLKFPTSIVNALYVDEVDQVWFIVHRPAQHLSEFEKDFFARLEFYKKGKDYHLHVSGKACIVSDPEEINNCLHLSQEIRQQAATSMVLVKMKIHKAEVFAHIQKHQVKEIRLPVVFQPSAFVKSLHYIVKDIIPVFQSH